MAEPIRILHVIGIMNRGGAETMIMNLYRHIDREKVQFDFVEGSSEPAVFDEEIQKLGGRIFRCPRYNGKNHLAYTKWWNDFFKEHRQQYAVVHGHIGSTAAIYLGIAKKHGIYTVAHSHSMINRISMRNILYVLFSYPTRFVANRFFACSKEAGISRYGRRIGDDSTRCILLRNAINLNCFSFEKKKRDEWRSALNLENHLVVGHVGRFDYSKNHEFLLLVFQKILLKRKDAFLLLVGDGERRMEMEQLAREYGVIDSVIFAGVVSNVNDYVQAMDVLVFPSRFEGLPVSLIEAQANGLPCCISDSVPSEVRITSCVEFMSLQDSTEAWADRAIAMAMEGRIQTKAQLQQAGYDIHETAKWLTDFYVEAAKRNE